MSKDTIVAAITLDPDKVKGDIPVIIAGDEEERERLARLMANILHAMVHDLGNGTYLIVQH